MKPAAELARENFRYLKACVHGGEIWDAADRTGLRREDILDFSSSVNPLGPSQKAVEAVKASLWQIPSYPDSNSVELRNAIASRYGGINRDNVIVGNGSTELIYLFAESFMQKGDVAVVPVPTFGEYESAVRKAGGEVEHARLTRDFHVEVGSFARAVIHRAKMVFFCNPNNPTSVLTLPESLREIIEVALEEDALVFLDEDFLEFVDEGENFSFIGSVRKYPNLFVLRSFTKIFGLAGLRVGYGIASEEIVDVLLNAKIPWNVNCLAQSAALAALSDEEHLRRTREIIRTEKVFLMNELHRFSGFRVYLPDANFILIDVRNSGYTAAQLKERMLGYGILIRDCSSFTGLDGYYIRIAVKTRRENERLLEALKKTVGT